MHFLYNILTILFIVLATPVFILRYIQEKGFGKRLRQSFGFLPEEDLDRNSGKIKIIAQTIFQKTDISLGYILW